MILLLLWVRTKRSWTARPEGFQIWIQQIQSTRPDTPLLPNPSSVSLTKLASTQNKIQEPHRTFTQRSRTEQKNTFSFQSRNNEPTSKRTFATKPDKIKTHKHIVPLTRVIPYDDPEDLPSHFTSNRSFRSWRAEDSSRFRSIQRMRRRPALSVQEGRGEGLQLGGPCRQTTLQ